MDVIENAAGIGDDDVGNGIDIANAVHALQRQDYVRSFGTRCLAAHEAGIAGLRHDGGAGLAGELQDGGNLFNRTGLDEQRRGAAIKPAIFHEARRHFRRVADRVLFADNGGKAVEDVGGGDGGGRHGRRLAVF